MRKNRFLKFKGGFTIIELMICVFIFAMMTTLLLAKYGSFNTNVLLTNLAYDVALTIRNAQSYGLNVKSSPNEENKFNYAYGVHIALGTEFIFFVDTDGDGVYDVDEKITSTTIKRGMSIGRICPGANECKSLPNTVNGVAVDWPESIDITYKRPNPEAKIVTTNNNVPIVNTSPYSSIALKNSLSTTLPDTLNSIDIVVNKNGAISIKK